MLTVVTPTYNRAHTIERTFNSLQKQTDKDFLWMVIDDGSTDNTKELIERFKEQAQFPIEYHYKSNGGRHTALNESYKYIKTKYVVNLDSDDEYTENAIELMKKIWKEVEEKSLDKCWCIVGRCIDSNTKEIVGREFPDGINNMKFGYKKRKAIFKAYGEKSCCRRFDILKQYPFPTYEDTKFVTENEVWEKINNKYDQWCTNEVFRLYYQNEADSLSAKSKEMTKKRCCFSYHAAASYINNCLHQILYNKLIPIELANVTRMGLHTGRNLKTILSDIEKMYAKILVLICSPVAYLYYLREKNGFEDE